MQHKPISRKSTHHVQRNPDDRVDLESMPAETSGQSMHVYAVKTEDGYLYPFADDASLTDDPEQAQRFSSTEEARATAEHLGYYDDNFEIIPLDLLRQRALPGAPPSRSQPR